MFKLLMESIINVFSRKLNEKLNKQQEEPDEEPIVNMEYDNVGSPSRELMDMIDYSIFPEITPVSGTDKEAKNLLVVDDIAMTEVLYKSDFEKIKKQHKKSISKDFNYYPCFAPEAGYIVYDLIFNKNVKIDYAILDLTLGYDFKLPNGEYFQLDGIDIANYLIQANPEVKCMFCSAHTMNENNSVVALYINKYKKLNRGKLEDFFICKNSNRLDGVYKLLYGEWCNGNRC